MFTLESASEVIDSLEHMYNGQCAYPCMRVGEAEPPFRDSLKPLVVSTLQ